MCSCERFLCGGDILKTYLCIQLHDVGHFVPAEAHEALVVLGTVSSHHHVRFEVRLPLHLVRCGGCSPFGIVGRSVTFGPHVIPEREGDVFTNGLFFPSIIVHQYENLFRWRYLKV